MQCTPALKNKYKPTPNEYNNNNYSLEKAPLGKHNNLLIKFRCRAAYTIAVVVS